MIGYLNECSLEEHRDWAVSLRFFLEAALELSGKGGRLFKDSNFFLTPDFSRRFSSLSLPSDVRGAIRDLAFGGRYYQCWRPERISNHSDIYICHGPEGQHLDESICEAAERKIQDDTSVVSLLSAADSEFRDRERVSISKDSTEKRIELRGVSSMPMLRKWITEQRGYYDPNSQTAPRDFQTILEKAPDRFRWAGLIERRTSRRVFQEIETGRLFHVDDGHPGHSAHLEVFTSRKEHVGVADINTGEVDTSEKVEGRTLKL